MYKLNKILTAFLVLAMLSACNKDFLDLAPLDQGSVALSYKTPESANQALMGIYDVTQGNAQDFARLTERTTDNAITQPSVGGAAGLTAVSLRELINFQYSSENEFMNNVWNSYYRGIAASNQLLERIEGIPFPDPALKDQYIGEAKFLRAYFYFNLVRFFGGVPLSLTEIKDPAEAFALTRGTEEEIYQAISTDLADASSKLPLQYTGNALGRITQGAAKALLAKVYLTSNNAALALPLLRELTTAPYKYTLMPTYPEVFSTDNTAESVFEIQYVNNIIVNEGNSLATFFFTNDGTIGKDIYGAGYTGPGGPGHVLASPDLYNSYEATDARRAYTILVYPSSIEKINVNIVRKYNRLPANGIGGADDNIIVLRYADVLLMLAEAINETNNGPTAEAYDAVDKVRLRAKVTPWARTLDYNTFKTNLLEERRKELAFEFHRWFDLKRFGKLVELLQLKKYPIQPFHVLFPIPRQQVEINPVNVPQNPGY